MHAISIYTRFLLLSPPHHSAYYLSTPQLVRNTLKCGASALGEGSFVVQAQPGSEASLPDFAAVTRFQATRIRSSQCGDEITIWVRAAHSLGGG